jgi:hypothetical protein
LSKGIDIVGAATDADAQRLGRAFETVEVIGVVAEEIVNRSLGRDRQKGCVWPRDALDPVNQRAVAGIELKESLHQPRRVVERGAQFGKIGGVAGKHRIAHRRPDIGERCDVGILHQRAHVDAVMFSQRQKHGHRQRSLVVFQQVDIGRADPEPTRHFRLGMPRAAAQMAQLGAHKCLCHVYIITESKIVCARINMKTRLKVK